MRRVLYTIIMATVVSVLYAQPVIPDSLRQSLLDAADDSGKVKRLIDATKLLPYIQSDSALYHADSILRLSARINFPYGLARGNAFKAEVYANQGDFARGLYFNQLALQQFESIAYDNDLWQINGRQGGLFSELGAHQQAIYYSAMAREMLFSYGDSIYNRITEAYESSGALRESRTYEYAKILLAANKPDSALTYLKIAEEIDRRINYNYAAIPVLFGDIYFQAKDYQTALQYYNALPTMQVALDKAKSLIGKANVFSKLQLVDSAVICAKQSLDAFRKINYAKGTMQAAGLLSELYETDQPQESIRYYRISNALKDSMYSREKVNLFNTIIFNEEVRKLDAKALEEKARNRYRLWSLLGGIFTLLVTGILLWRNNQHRKTANLLLQKEKKHVEATLEKLKSTQAQLIQSEKMASLGELTAGIAHEIQNPLNFVNNFSEVNKELLDELNEEIKKGNYGEVEIIASDIRDNEEKISHHGQRADAIVKGMLQHSRTTSTTKEPTDINILADEYLQLAYKGLRAKDKNFHADLKTSYDQTIQKISVIPPDIGRVLLNLYNNAFYAVNEKKKSNPLFTPELFVSTKKLDNGIQIAVTDNGNGIPAGIIDKIFQPFFTTKPTGEGTGLGLSLSYDIIKAHGGKLIVKSKEGEGTEFTISLPL